MSGHRAGTLGQAARRLRALRLLPADLPDVRAVGRGDGLAPRADSAHAARARAADPVRGDGHPPRPVPGLHGVRDRVPVGGQVRPAAAPGSPADRAPSRSLAGRSGLPPADLRGVPASRPAARDGADAGAAAPGRRRAPPATPAAAAARHGGADSPGPPPGDVEPSRRGDAGAGHQAWHGGAAAGLRPARLLLPRQPRHRGGVGGGGIRGPRPPAAPLLRLAAAAHRL